MAFRIENVIVTPAFARELLGRNADNQRNIRPMKVDQYARDIATGHWLTTGDTVKVSTEGRLIDGQHRLTAIIQADTAMPMLIAYDVEPGAMTVLDIGIGRNFGDTLKVKGASRRLESAAIVRRVLMWEDGNRMGSGGATARTPSHPEMLLRYEQDEAGFDSAATRATDVRRAKLGAAAAVGTCYYLFAQIDGEWTHRFFDSYIIGANLPEGNPILALRNRMVRVGRDERLMPHEIMALFIRSWNAYREGRALVTVPITTGGRKLTNTTFPIPK